MTGVQTCALPILNARSLIAQGRAEVISQKNFTPEWLATHIDELMERSAARNVEGSYSDRDAAWKIANYMESALECR